MLNKEWTYDENKAWMDRVTQYGCVITGANNGIVRHHPLGRKAKKNKYWIGQRFVYCLYWELHEVRSDHPLNVSYHKNAFIDAYGKESDIFYKMCMRIKEQDGSLPFPDEELQAIMDTNA